MNTITVIETNYNEIEAMCEAAFGVRPELLATTYNIHNDTWLLREPDGDKASEDYFRAEVEEIGEEDFAKGIYGLQRALNLLRYKGIIGPGYYLVEIMW